MNDLLTEDACIELFFMHKTTSGEKRKALRKEALELAKQSRAATRPSSCKRRRSGFGPRLRP